MAPDPKEPPRPGRLIVPGAEPDEPRADAPRIVTPGGDAIAREPEERAREAGHGGEAERGEPASEPEAPRGRSRIVLPPGVSRETPDDLPEYPKLRPVMLVPIRDRDRELVLVSDPLGVIPGQPVLGMEALPILQLLDGTVSLTDLSAALMRESKDLRIGNMVRDFVAQLDELLMLDSPRFARAYRELQQAYHPLEIRPAALEGRAYPADRAELSAFLDAHFAAAEKWRAEAGEPVAAADARPRALLAPHLDPRRSGAAIARAMLEIGATPARPLRVVVFGTGHQLIGDSFALTRKHFETPLGRVPCDTAFVDRVAAKLGDFAYRSELAHRDEHSIEFEAVFLRKRMGDRPFTIVPILCGGFHDLVDEGRTPREDAGFETLIGAVREAEHALGGDTVYLAGVDFSHVGPRFGDPRIEAPVAGEIERMDRAAIAAAVKGDADAWFRAIADHGDSTRICGFAPVYALLRCAEPGAGRLLRYEQSKEDDTSLVTVAAMVWP
jgi:AmmeMemoRadiSam system protein B